MFFTSNKISTEIILKIQIPIRQYMIQIDWNDLISALLYQTAINKLK